MNVIELIQKHKLELDWAEDESNKWLVSAFPCYEGGYWSEFFSTVEEAVKHCIELNELS